MVAAGNCRQRCGEEWQHDIQHESILARAQDVLKGGELSDVALVVPFLMCFYDMNFAPSLLGLGRSIYLLGLSSVALEKISSPRKAMKECLIVDQCTKFWSLVFM